MYLKKNQTHRFYASLAVIALLAAVLIAGCTVGPNYQQPALPLPRGFAEVNAGRATTAPATQQSVTIVAAAHLGEWWKAFGDPELDSLIQRAAAQNLTVLQAQARLRQARAQRGVVYSGLFPAANADGSIGRAQTAGGGRSNTFAAGFDAAWELDIFGGTRRGVEAADYSIRAGVADVQDATLTLVAEVAVNYIQLRGYQRQIVIARNNLVVQERTADVTHRRLVGGLAASLDTANADAQVASTEAAIPQLQTQAQQTIYAIALLLSLNPAELNDELRPDAAIPPVPMEIPIGLPSDLLRRRPDVRRAEWQLAAATATVGQNVALLFPQFSLTGTLGLSNGQLHSLPNWSSSGYWTIGPSVSWPIFDAGKIRAQIEVQNALQEQALGLYVQTVLQSLNDVEQALVAYGNEQQHRRSLQVAVAKNRQAVDISNQLYTTGTTNFLNVLVAEGSLFSTENQLVQSDVTVATNLVALYKALGGGWDIASQPKQPLTQPPIPLIGP